MLSFRTNIPSTSIISGSGSVKCIPLYPFLLVLIKNINRMIVTKVAITTFDIPIDKPAAFAAFSRLEVSIVTLHINNTPTEIMEAIELGLTTLKFFPAGVFGGLKAINALGAAFPQVKFMPTGGVDNSNLKEFISCNKIIACGGSWMCKGTPEEITAKCLEARKIIKGE